MNTSYYLACKREAVLGAIKPICDVFGINSYDYEIDIEKDKEYLRIYGTKINCCGTSISGIVDELIGYIFVKRWCVHRYLGAFEAQTLKVIKRAWIADVKE